jgi:transcriptional regulator with XRE-family HTH domain
VCVPEIAIGVLADRLKVKRAGRGVRAVAKEIGISPATYSRVENKNLPDLLTFRRLCEWVGLDPNDVLGVRNVSGSATPSAMVHFKNNKTSSPEIAAALSEMILKAKAAMAADDF